MAGIGPERGRNVQPPNGWELSCRAADAMAPSKEDTFKGETYPKNGPDSAVSLSDLLGGDACT